MSLSFTPEMQVTLPEYLTGTARFQNINKLIAFNAIWKKEAFEHLTTFLSHMRDIEASDIDIGGPGTNGHIWYRIFGQKKPDETLPRYSADEITAIILSILSDEQKVVLFKNKNVDFSLSLKLREGEKNSRFRGDVYYENNNLVANFRRINQNLFPIAGMGFPQPILQRMNILNEKSGLVLVTGITGSGKSSTLDAVINLNNESSESHIVIIGNPIEFVHESKKCIVRHRQVGEDVMSFQAGAIEALRQDPDVIVVGEMRDPETIATVLEVTDSGHKVFTTLHTSSAIDSIHRIVGEFPPREQDRIRLRLADTLSICLSQKLVPSKDGKRVLAKEILSVTDSVKAAIRNQNIGEIYQMVTEGKKYGMMTMEQDLYNHYRKGVITRENALNYANNRKRMIQLLSY